MPTFKITAPRNLGKVKQGKSFTIVSRTTGGEPDAMDIEEVLYTRGYNDTSTLSYRSAGNWEVIKINDDTYPDWNEQHEAYLAQKKAYEKEEADKRAAKREAEEERSNNNSNSTSQSASSLTEKVEMGSCAKIFFTITLILPIWWLIKLPFTMGYTGVKIIYYIISWPFRLLFCCCCNTKLIPEDNLSVWPKYEF